MARATTKAPAPARKGSPLRSDLMQLKAFSAGVDRLARAMPGRTSIRQALAFIMLGEQIIDGQEVVISDLRHNGGEDNLGNPLFDESIGRSYQLFLDEPTKDYPTPLQWIRLETDPSDRRRKIVRLTAKGEAMLKQVMKDTTRASPPAS